MKMYREKVVEMFHHAYDNYLENAFPFDELRPLSCSGVDTWGSFSLSLIDALDTLAVMENYSEFRRVVNKLIKTADFNININVSVFETNIRVVGGLISAHLLSKKAGVEVDPGWPCSGPLLNLAETVARRLLPAFESNTGMPYGTVNLRYGVPVGETPITCTAGVSTFIVEFGTLSRLTGDPIFEKTAMKALDSLWDRRSPVGLVGNHINVQEGKWTAMDAGIGGGIDSYYEYLVKGAMLFQKPKLIKMFKEYQRVIAKYMKRDDWYFWVSMASGQVTMPIFQSLEAYWPGLLSLVGEIEQALKTLYNYHQVWKQYGFTPEFYDIPHSHVKREGYPLRPELVESVMYLYRATRDPRLLEIGVDILESIQHSAKTNCGYATIKNVLDHRVEDRMESFFLAETTKYLYLLFDPGNFIHNNGSCGDVVSTTGGECVLGSGGYIFNTEAHPIDVAAVYCCSAERKAHQALLQDFQNTMDLHSLLDINEKGDFLRVFKRSQKKKRKCENMSNSGKFGKESCGGAESATAHVVAVNQEHAEKGSDSKDSQPDFFRTKSSEMLASIQASLLSEDESSSITSDIPTEILETSDLLDTNFSIASSSSVEVSETDSSTETQNLINTVVKVPSVDAESSKLYSSQSSSTSETVVPINKGEGDGEELVVQSANINKPESLVTGTPSKSIPVVPVIPESSEMISKSDMHREGNIEEEVSGYELLSCPAQPFTARLTVMGEMFNTDS